MLISLSSLPHHFLLLNATAAFFFSAKSKAREKLPLDAYLLKPEIVRGLRYK